MAPFRLQHGDFDGQNLLFTDPKLSDGTSPPHLVGVIDWDHTHTTPLYFLYEYPIFIRDCDYYEHLYEENAILRRHFVRALREQFPPGSAHYLEARACIPSGRSSILNVFKDVFMTGVVWDDEVMCRLLKAFVGTEKEGIGGGRLDWVHDSDESDSGS